jgi:signal transduction histidine kinase
VVITQFNVKDKAQLISSDELILNYDNNYVSFEFAALNYFRNNENIYAYKLDGVDKDWVYCGNRRFTNYASLAPGNYTFRVKSSNSYGIWSTHQAEVKFKILSPWYTSWWFYVLVFCSVFSIIYLLYHYRLQQAIELESVRNSIARDLHDEIGSNLSSISLFTEVAKEKSATSESGVSGILQKISDYTQTSQEAMNDIVWMINTRNDRFENIIVRMRSLAVELLEAKNIHLHLSFDERLNQLKMGMNERKNFYLLYKEILNNCVKYAEANQVWIELSITSNVILLSIKDDGIGFDPAVQLNGNGLINMKKRAEVLGATLTINSSKGTGTHTKLTFQT